MNKILLINPGHHDPGAHEMYKKKAYRQVHRDPPPISLLYVATHLEQNGFAVEILDTHIEENYRELITEKIKNNDYLCVGLTIIIGRFLKNAREITELIRSLNPALPIVWGGIMASIMPEECLREYEPDFIVRYEGEQTMLELARALEKKTDLSAIDGLSYMKQGQVINNHPRIPSLILDNYAIPDWELFGDYFNKEQVPYYFLIMSSRGCIFNCKFCYKHSMDEYLRASVPPWRYRSAEHVIAEIEYIHKKVGTTVFSFGDDNFIVNKPRALKILNYFKEHNFYIEECLGHLNCLDDELIDAMAGVVQTFAFNVETASPRLQKYINKGIRLETVPVKVKKLYDKGIAANTGFIIGLPTETDDDLRSNIAMMLEMKRINPFSRGDAYLFLPLLKTQLAVDVEELYKIKLPTAIKEWEDANLWVKGVDDDMGKKFRPWMSQERFKFLVNYGTVFNELFKTNNSKMDQAILSIIDENFDLQKIYKGAADVNRPKTDYRPYVLSRVLNGEKINLINDLKNK